MIFNILGGLAGQIIGVIGKGGKARQDILKARVDSMKRTWVDEMLFLYWFSPSIVAWWDTEKSTAMIDAMSSNKEFFAIQVAITCAVFGLNKLNGKASK